MTAGIVLAGGRSSRMGAPKAWLDWHGSTLLRRTCGLVARGTGGPVVVVRAPAKHTEAAIQPSSRTCHADGWPGFDG